ncbi:MAG: RNA polymerase sigma factor [Planctomycetes bacterium]|nr:RNA polymerase sigma factor [Planctomycetota bacterium]
MKELAPIVMPRPTGSRSPADEAFARRLEELRAAVASLLRRAVRQPDRRSDALQETFTRAWAARGQYDATRPLGPWLATIAWRVAHEQERRRARRREDEGSEPLLATTGGPDEEPAALLERREAAASLTAALAELPPLPRETVRRFYAEAESVAQIAAALQLPENTVKSHLRRARLALAKTLAPHEAPDETPRERKR